MEYRCDQQPRPWRYQEEYVYAENERVYQSAPLPQPTNNQYRRNELIGELGTVATGTFALYEAHRASADPAHASKHKIEAGLAGAAALASAGYAFYEHHQKDKYPNW